jgi:hypothetical protein
MKSSGHQMLGSQVGVTHLNQWDLAKRWRLSPRTLERWRWARRGPRVLKIGGRCLYRLRDVEAFEADRLGQGEKSEKKRTSQKAKRAIAKAERT